MGEHTVVGFLTSQKLAVQQGQQNADAYHCNFHDRDFEISHSLICKKAYENCPVTIPREF